MRALSERAMHVKGLVRDAAQAVIARRLGAAEVAVGDLRDRKSLEAALENVDEVFYIAPAFIPNEAELGVAFVDAVKRSHAQRIVFSSVIHPILGIENHMAKIPVEAAILDSGLEYTFLHPTAFFQNYARAWPAVLETGVLAEPWSTEHRFTRVDYRDVAEVAAIALVEDRLLNGTFELCAEGDLNRRDVAALISQILGREVRAERSNPDVLGEQARRMRPMFRDYYDRHGMLGNALTLRAILGRRPRTLRALLRGARGRDAATDICATHQPGRRESALTRRAGTPRAQECRHECARWNPRARGR